MKIDLLIYGQDFKDDPVLIVGTKKALRDLKNKINKLLRTEEPIIVETTNGPVKIKIINKKIIQKMPTTAALEGDYNPKLLWEVYNENVK
jgi:hypothetical protein